MGLDKYSAGSFEEMAEQNEAAEVNTPAKPATENVATEAKTEEAPATDVKADNVETPKTV